MSGIICAIRGGVASQPTMERAIQAAIETGLPLYFLYVVNIDFMMHTAQSRVQIITKELRELGEFILLSAQTKAESRGVTAEVALREGSVAKEIIELSHQVGADYVVLGRPRQTHAANVFTHDLLSEFGQRLETETGAKVIFAQEM